MRIVRPRIHGAYVRRMRNRSDVPSVRPSETVSRVENPYPDEEALRRREKVKVLLSMSGAKLTEEVAVE